MRAVGKPGPALPQPCQRRVRARFVSRNNDDAGSHPGKLFGGNFADPGRAPCDDYRFALHAAAPF
jgi:hypothetical protein